jgi:hypothetical protein
MEVNEGNSLDKRSYYNEQALENCLGQISSTNVEV